MTGVQDVELPEGSGILAVQPQGTGVCLWAFVHPERPKVKREILIFGTGHEIPEHLVLTHLETFQMGPLVFHAFERGR